MTRAEQIVTPCFARLKWQWGNANRSRLLAVRLAFGTEFLSLAQGIRWTSG
jgi:hypothetical protein